MGKSRGLVGEGTADGHEISFMVDENALQSLVMAAQSCDHTNDM